MALAGLERSLKAMYAARKTLRWAENRLHETPAMIADGILAQDAPLPASQRALHRALLKGNLLKSGTSASKNDGILDHSSALVRMALRCPHDFTPTGELQKLSECLQTAGQAALGLQLAMASSDPHALVYAAVAMLDLKYGIKQVGMQMDKYLARLLASSDPQQCIDPMLYYVHYLIWQKTGSSNKKADRVRAACALMALRCFPQFAEAWVDEEDDVDSKVRCEGLLEGDESDDEDEEATEDAASSSKDSPEAEWQLAKADHNLVAESMDKLMALTGLRDIKKKAMGVVKEVLLQKDRPASVKAETSMNFLFTGNPGCGKVSRDACARRLPIPSPPATQRDARPGYLLL